MRKQSYVTKILTPLFFVCLLLISFNISAQPDVDRCRTDPWLCPGYQPGPGFPGNPNPIFLPTAPTQPGVRPAPGDPIFLPFGPDRPFPGPPYLENPNKDYNKPCPGDPIKDPQIAATNGWNVNGGKYGKTRNNNTQFHDGIDISAMPGRDLYSMYSGEVTAIENSFEIGEYRSRSYGNYIEIKSIIDGKVVYFKYNHLDEVDDNIKVGDQITQQQHIGQTGDSGNAANISLADKHVHIQAKDENKKSIDPEPYLRTKFDKTTGKSTNPCPQ